MRARVVNDEAPESAPTRPTWGLEQQSVAAGLAVFVLALLLQFLFSHTTFSPLLAAWRMAFLQPLPHWLLIAAPLTASIYLLPRALRAVRAFRADMHLLVSIAVIGAMFLGEYIEAFAVATLFAGSLWLEQWSVRRAGHAIHALLDLAPLEARVVDGVDTADAGRLVSAQEVSVGSLLRVLPGERVPMDGQVVRGETSVDQAPITGESVPVPKHPGDQVIAGTINIEASFDYRTSATAKDSTPARILKMVSEAHARKADAERWIDAFAARYTPAMVLFALVVGVLRYLLGASWQESVNLCLTVLLIGCPCALVISTPVTIVAAIASCARHGVLVKGGRYLEALTQIRVFAFDKTGTLSEGRPRVSAIHTVAPITKEEVLAVAAAIEQHAGHPIARAIREAAEGLELPALDAGKSLPGKGASGRIGGVYCWAGNARMLESVGLNADVAHAMLGVSRDFAGGIVYVGRAEQLLGALEIEDGMRRVVPQAMAELRSMGIQKVALLSGDHAAPVAQLARRAGIDLWRANLLPEEKAKEVENLARDLGPVAMVGDGVNDAPALAAARVGVAMGAAGSDAALESADVALMTDDLLRLPWLLKHARRTLGILRQNVVIALGLKLAVFLVAVGGFSQLWMAIAADMGAAVIVIANGMRLLRERLYN
jgi:Cd2+/Zn2+-exporting ATPase